MLAREDEVIIRQKKHIFEMYLHNVVTSYLQIQHLFQNSQSSTCL